MTDRRDTIRTLFGRKRPLVGMLHLPSLPGSPHARLGVDEIVAHAVAEARVYRDGGFDGLMIENMHDRPYLKREVGAEVVAVMAAVGRELRRAVPLPLGVQVLAGANRQALAVAAACGAAFVRVEGFVFGHVADEGLVEADAGDLLRERRRIGADGVLVFADVKKKHSSHALTADVDIAETARAAEFCLADGVIVTGSATGCEADAGEVTAVVAAVGVPVLVGSGVTAENLRRYAAADGFIVGSAVKRDAHWAGPLDPARVAAIVAARAGLPEDGA
jgi:membrane complex biogenesis BtpA family protein